MKVAVIGNITLDVICKTVNEVPRYDSIAFEQAIVSPGGCGSNVAIGLAATGIPTLIIGCIGQDASAEIIIKTWDSIGLDYRFVELVSGASTGVSVGLIDSDAQPRFIHTTGANAYLTAEAIDLDRLFTAGVKHLHVAGFFVLTGMLDEKLSVYLERARKMGIVTSLDVVRSPRMDHPEILWPCVSQLDIFMCNAYEGWRLSGE